MNVDTLSNVSNNIANSPTIAANNSTNSLNQSSTNNQSISNQLSSLGTSSDENNPFDVTENKDYFKSQDIEIKQLILNVRNFFYFKLE